MTDRERARTVGPMIHNLANGILDAHLSDPTTRARLLNPSRRPGPVASMRTSNSLIPGVWGGPDYLGGW